MEIVSEIEYKRAFTEVLAILNLISDEYYNKIPKDIILTLEKMRDDSYNYQLEFNKKFNEQKVSEVSKAILSNFYRDYWATDIEKNKIIEEEKTKRIQVENEKREKYNPDDIFKDKKDLTFENENSSRQTYMIKNKESFIKRIIKKIIEIFKV